MNRWLVKTQKLTFKILKSWSIKIWIDLDVPNSKAPWFHKMPSFAFVARMVSEAWACTAAQQMCAALEYIHFKADGSDVNRCEPLWLFTGFHQASPSHHHFYRFYKPFPDGWFILIYGIVLPILAYDIEATNQMFIAQDGIEWWGVWWFLPININESGLMLTVQQTLVAHCSWYLQTFADYLVWWILHCMLWNGAFPGWKH